MEISRGSCKFQHYHMKCIVKLTYDFDLKPGTIQSFYTACYKELDIEKVNNIFQTKS